MPPEPALRPARNAAASHGLIRLMLVDDSITARTVLSRIVERQGDMAVAATASSAEQALDLLRTVEVDVILLDLEMPGIGGLGALPAIIAAARGARIMVVSALTVAGAEHTVQALALGAADTLVKPAVGGFDEAYRSALVDKIRSLGNPATDATRAAPKPAPAIRPASRKSASIVAIGASTGGIHALGHMLGALPHRLDVPIVITQHLPGSFMEVFAQQLARVCGYQPEVARDGTRVRPGHILVAPGHAHMTLVQDRDGLAVRLNRAPAASGCTPSVDPMFASLARVLGPHVVGVLLSGMGRDGLEGARMITAAGGSIFAQDEASSAVWGMPRAVAEAGLASAILPPEQIAARIAACAGMAA